MTKVNSLKNPVFAAGRIIGRAFTMTAAAEVASRHAATLNPNAAALPVYEWNGIEITIDGTEAR